MMTHGGQCATFPKKIQQSVLAFCVQNRLFNCVSDNKKHVVYVAISGGPDSMALLHVLRAISSEINLDVRACHVNHGTRINAQRDEDFVKAECEKNNIPFVLYRAQDDNVPMPHHATEDWARKLRYGYFDELAIKDNATIATAHTLCDQAETLLFRLARGTGVHGAAGIRPSRGIYRRPFLGVKRDDVLAYCVSVGQSYIIDEMNATDIYARNRLRHGAMPALESTNEAALKNLGAFCEKMSEIDAYFCKQAQDLLQTAKTEAQNMKIANNCENVWALEPLQKANSLVLSAALHSLVSKVRDAEQKYIDLLSDCILKGEGAVQLRDDTIFKIEKLKMPCLVRLNNCQSYIEVEKASYNLQFAEGEYELSHGFCVKIEVFPVNETEKIQLVHKKDLTNIADYDKIISSSRIRTRMGGDVFSPRGRRCTKSLKKYQNECGTPKELREKLPLIAHEKKVLWLWDDGFAEGFAPTDRTKTICKITQIKKNVNLEDVK